MPGKNRAATNPAYCVAENRSVGDIGIAVVQNIDSRLPDISSEDRLPILSRAGALLSRERYRAQKPRNLPLSEASIAGL